MIEELNKVLEKRELYLDQADTNEWRIYDKENDKVWGNFYISSKGQYEFNLAKNFYKKEFLQQIKKDIARVISRYDDYAY